MSVKEEQLVLDDLPYDFKIDEASFINYLPDSDGETIDIAKLENLDDNPIECMDSPHGFVPFSPRGPPSRVNFGGKLNFALEVNASDIHKRKYLYSLKMNRIYVDIRSQFVVAMRWDHLQCPAACFVRATVIFSDETQAEKRVERCLQHRHESTNSNLDAKIVHNVLRSDRDINTSDVFYCGVPENADYWYSVLVRLNPTRGQCSHAYQFVCKNSCSSGINRRAIDIIYTLEDEAGYVYGRQTVGARVCACPKRDLLKDEESARIVGKKRLLTGSNKEPNPNKKLKIDVTTNGDMIVLPPLQIHGVRTAIAGFEVMVRMTEQKIELLQNSKNVDNTQIDTLNKSKSDIKVVIENCKKMIQ